jgi:hypothetical protein
LTGNRYRKGIQPMLGTTPTHPHTEIPTEDIRDKIIDTLNEICIYTLDYYGQSMSRINTLKMLLRIRQAEPLDEILSYGHVKGISNGVFIKVLSEELVYTQLQE